MEEKFFSQYGEDRILNDIFAGKSDGVCVEVGGFDGITGSNSYFFETKGWTCIVVEPIPALCEMIRKNRKCALAEVAASERDGVATLHVVEGAETLSTVNETEYFHERVKREGRGGVREISVRTRRLDDILAGLGVDRIDFISIDVEGHEMPVLNGFSLERFKPRVIIIENNLNAEDLKIRPYLASHGYVRFKRTGCNDWYARGSDKSLVSISSVIRTNFQAWSLRDFVKAILPSFAVAAVRRWRRRGAGG